MSQYIVITDDESKPDSLVEVPLEEDGMLLVTTLESQFAGASGLKYRAASGAFRGLRVADDKVHPPTEGWETAANYVVVCTAKRKADSSLDGPPAKLSKSRVEETDVTDSDLIVLGIPYTFTTADLQAFFSQFGQLKVCQVVLDNKTGQSKGFGFIRFMDGETNKSVEATKFYQVGGRRCEVKLPQRRSTGGQSSVTKLFVGCLTQQITRDDLLAYFAMYGEVTDVYVPSPFRGFAFITFADPRAASAALDTGNHVLNGVQINVTVPNPRKKEQNNSQQVANAFASQALTSQALLQQLALAGTGLNSASLSGAAGLGAAGLGLDLNTLSSLATLGGAAALGNPAATTTTKTAPTTSYKW
ncbi:TAR DNA-binding protein 43-like [Sycon ciliatum]|uniref:TAR DNA-binding protein 43-like n=1 Tax=Sycon ciliatum TaxID=27933 RepID=UPI0020A939F5|eukprot:scpid85841/ scgid13243/ TAR DNA-binding protein 43